MHTLSAGRRTAAMVAGIVMVQALFVLAFGWPAANLGPRELPVAVAGPAPAVEQVESALAAAPGPDADVAAFDVVLVADESAARAAIEDRDVYGAVVISPDGPRLLVASAAGPAVAQLLRTAAGELGPPSEAAVVEDVVPSDPDDPLGAGLGAGILPLVVTSAAAGAVAALTLRATRYRLAAVTGVAIGGGLASAAVLQYLLGVFDGLHLGIAAVLTLLIGAVAATVAGLTTVLGRGGAVLGVLTVIVLGSPLSAATSAAQLLPSPWGALGQLLPPGAGVSALRGVAFFDGASAAQPLTVLSIWLLAGLALLLVGGLRRSDPAAAGAATARELSVSP